MRIGVFGGSFDPVHNGHLLLAECCAAQAQLDRLLFVPTAHQPLKPRGPAASNEDRLAMLRLAIAGLPQFEVSTVEIDRGGMSYTVDTLRAVQERFPGDELYLLMGEDSVTEFAQWREPDEICRLARPVVVRRGVSLSDGGAGRRDSRDEDNRVEAFRPFASPKRLAEISSSLVEMPDTPISSTEIRRRIAADGNWESLVPGRVAQFIRQRGLYR